MWLYLDIAVFICDMVVTGLIIPQILLIAFRKKLFDEPDPRKIHQGAVPRLGGIAFFPAMLFSILFVLGIVTMAEGFMGEYEVPVNFRAISMITCAVTILYLIGMADDLIGVKYRAKFLTQILAGLFLFVGGVIMDNFHGFLWINQLPLFIQILFTVILTVFITNAINLIDGIDGLASGLSSLAFIFYGILFYAYGLQYYSILCFAALGTLVPFFYYNVFGSANRHKKIFMGDTGALTIGLLLSACSLRLCMISDSADGVNPAVAAFAPLLIPCFDVVRVYLRRLRRRKNPFLPDKTHIHHKLLALGIPQRVAMPMILIFGAGLILLNYWLGSIINITFMFLIDLAIWVGANILLTRLIRRRESRLHTPLFE